ncbi:MAG: ATP-binding region, ATPase domain protein [Nocardioides sp.]|jgi:signal transduction histidine kinase|nr:ATP-binding region, ATPase domain protein [Nocardioides sp.]
MTGTRRQQARLSAAARGFALIALVAPVLWSRDAPALVALASVGVIWAVGQVLETRGTMSVMVTSVVGAALVGTVCGLAMQTSPVMLGALAVAPFTAGVHRGLRAVGLALSAQLIALVVLSLIEFGRLSDAQGLGAFTWSVTGLGLGLIATFLHSALQQAPDPLAPYHDAQALIRELIDLSGGLSSGLDPVPTGAVILSTVRDELPTEALVLYVPRGESLTPLISKTNAREVDTAACDDLAVEAWALRRPVVAGHAFAFPIATEVDTTAVVAGLLSDRLDPRRLGIHERIERLMGRLGASAVHLDTALLFAAFRDAATADERRRLAREMHDGVAQDIASLGYLVDALAAHPASSEQAERIAALRDRITAVVAEVRRSLVTLRTDAGSSESLGAAIGSIARNLTEVSGVPIQVTLDERTTRLRPEVEDELFRITQEAMTNAVRHSRARSIDVNCQVHAPDAVITVTDDGQGLQQARTDSQGLQIMGERALSIGAELTITPRPSGGTVVTVRAPGDPSAAPATPAARVTA